MKPKFTITSAITAGLAAIERARGFLEGVQLSETLLASLRDRAFIREAHYTTHIEGTQLTLDQSERLLHGKEVKGVDADDRRELLNYARAFDFVSGYLKKQSPITEALIREIQAYLVRGVRGTAATPGEYRKVPNYVVNSQTGEVIYTPPDAFLVPGIMAELAAYLQQPHETHAVLVAGIAQFELVQIHPFLDGNGRTARLLSTLYLYRSGYDFKRLFTLSEFYDRDRPAYYRVLQQVREDDLDLTPWLEYFVEGLAVQLEEVQAEATQGVTQLSAGEQQILTLAKQLGEFGISDLEIPSVSRRTVQRHLKSLVERGLLSRSGATNRRRYRANL